MRNYISWTFPTRSFEKDWRDTLPHINELFCPLNYLQTTGYMKSVQTIFHHSRDDILFLNFSSCWIMSISLLQPSSGMFLVRVHNWLVGLVKNSAQECTPAFQHHVLWRQFCVFFPGFLFVFFAKLRLRLKCSFFSLTYMYSLSIRIPGVHCCIIKLVIHLGLSNCQWIYLY